MKMTLAQGGDMVLFKFVAALHLFLLTAKVETLFCDATALNFRARLDARMLCRNPELKSISNKCELTNQCSSS